MKMVSQLTRRAMSRHRTVSVSSVSDAASAREASTSAMPLYSSAASAKSYTPPKAPAAPIAERPRTIYQQLMARHDRMRERHVPRTPSNT